MRTIDPITYEIVKNTLATAADEMSITMYRTAYSTIVRDCLDYSTQITNADGEMIAQGVTIPLHIGSAPFAMKALFNKYRDDIKPGDIFILNDPFDGGMHTPDIFIVKPIFWKDQRVSFAIATAHHLDVGGRVPGSSACDNTEIYQDGLRIPWLKLYHGGKADTSLFSLLRANVRVPEMTFGDIQAQVNACHVAEKRIRELIDTYGLEVYQICTEKLIKQTEQIVRDEIRSWPDGSYDFSDYLDSDGVGGGAVKIYVKLTVKGDTLTADFTGSSEQVQGSINSTLSYTASVTAACVRSVLREKNVPNTAGMFKPLTIIAPEATIVNVSEPGASSMRGVTGFRMVDAVLGAMSKILPDRIPACGEGGNSLVIIGGHREDKSNYVYFELLTGDWGGRPDRDGVDALCNPVNVASNIPIEEAECSYPILIEKYGLANDSGGAGKYRGGMAIERQWRLLYGNAKLTIRSDRRDHPPYGLYGGRTGQGSINILSGLGKTEQVLPTFVSTTMNAGQTLYHRMPGGGGWGNPLERDPAKVVEDVKNEKVSIDQARQLYGVVIHNDSFVVDTEETNKLRKRLLTK
jgi:N-methylhydantoinase B/oxoprolinase/acetone carboxylase alpha subunit